MEIAADLSLSELFRKEPDPLWFEHQYFPVSCAIPDDMEPEIGLIYDRMELAHRLDDHILSHPRVKQVGEVIPHDGFLISLAQDTVGKDGLATHIIADADLENRRRFNYNASSGKISRYDVSFKSAGKNSLRQEWEAPAIGFNTGMVEARDLVAVKHPLLASVDPDAFRVGGVCVASRATTNYKFLLSDGSALIKVQSNIDACAFANPHGDVLLGYRRETEPEITEVCLAIGANDSDERVKEVLTQGMDELKEIIDAAPFRNKLTVATESKGAQAMRLSAEFYENQIQYDGFDGRDIALMQNVTAESYYGKATALQFLSRTIPSSDQLSKGTLQTRYQRKFPTRSSSPKNPAHGRLLIVRLAA